MASRIWPMGLYVSASTPKDEKIITPSFPSFTFPLSASGCDNGLIFSYFAGSLYNNKKHEELRETTSREREDKPQPRRKHLEKTHLIKDCYPKYTETS